MNEGHEQLCYYCGKPCNSLHGNPSLWPIPLCHPNEPGVVKWHHIGCVSERLEQGDLLKQAIDAANSMIGHQANENDRLVAALLKKIDELETQVALHCEGKS